MSVEERNARASDTDVKIRLSQEELRDKSHVFILCLTMMMGWANLLGIAVRVDISVWLTVLIALLCCGSGVSAALRKRWPRAARLVLVIVLYCAYFCALLAYPGGRARYFGTLIIVACATMMPITVSSVTAVLICLGLVLLQFVAPSTAVGWSEIVNVIVMVLLSTMLAGVGTYEQDLALEWASISTSRAMQLTSELRKRQLVLNRTLRAMDEANERLVIANERLDEARSAADEARQAKARFAASISHELRTPLNLIVGFTETMYRNPRAYQGVVLSSEFLLDLGAIYRSGEHLQKLVDDVLDLAQIDAGKVVLEWSDIHMPQLVKECVETISGLATLRGLQVEVDVASNLPAIHTDRTRVKQVLLNLLSNAARYTERGKIIVRVHIEGAELVCTVQDTGPGIAPQNFKRLFEEFERVNASPNPTRKGTGLGLAISKRFIQALGGRIWAESELGVGSTFAFALPLAPTWDQPVTLRVLPSRTEGQPSAYQPKDAVLLISTDVQAARLFGRYLESYRCLTISELRGLPEQVALLQPRGIIMDESLGTEAIQQVSRLLEHMPVLSVPLVICPMPVRQQARVLDYARRFLIKPVSRQNLLDTLRSFGDEVSTLLVVDDEEDVLRLFGHYLLDDAAHPYRILMAHDAQEALRILQRVVPDLIFLDLVMPGMDGYQLMDVLQASPKLRDIPIIVVSGQDISEESPIIEGWTRTRLPRGMRADQLIRSVNELIRTLQPTQADEA